ncbi:DUF1534 domain-containing protein [Pseudomonas syringae]|nr:DUF1534 domain-containing protein [Pseudomonas syringae]MCF5481994.1 DUF1534 domain-containing protein [Pseudomonas syringae]MCF5487044.1 DUF1534 domain-containing protein [Pseudomonas syringae]MCF5524371.1 DUF1534 domain-containing protein [Pseudomonas syringae]MCF5572093.1 DUF1534 domain-containing protein [Pseudomonas syringae]
MSFLTLPRGDALGDALRHTPARKQKRNKTWHSCPEKWHIGAPWHVRHIL